MLVLTQAKRNSHDATYLCKGKENHEQMRRGVGGKDEVGIGGKGREWVLRLSTPNIVSTDLVVFLILSYQINL